MKTSAVICVLASVASTNAFTVSNPARTQTALSADVSRNNFLKQVAGAGVAAAAGVFNPMAAFADEEVVKLPSGTSYVVVKSGEGPAPKIGELAGIKFRAKVVQSGKQIDDIFDFPEPYYTRVGSGGLIKGVEEVLPSMRVGDRRIITVQTNMAFGPKGRSASAGKPRIPGDAIIEFEVEMVSLPGREQELIDIIGDE